MTSKHTPGPWIAYGDEVHDRPTNFDENGSRIGNTPNLICTVEYPYSDPRGQLANALLIASAPCLLAFVESLLKLNLPEHIMQRAADLVEKAKGAE
jgi:hypothetical protein